MSGRVAPPPPAAPSSPRIAPLERSALRDGSEPLPRDAGADLNGIIRDGYGRDASLAELAEMTGLSKGRDQAAGTDDGAWGSRAAAGGGG